MTDPIADALLRHYLTPPPAPAAPPKPTWTPSSEAAQMAFLWATDNDQSPVRDFLRRLYAQLHRDRVAALPAPSVDVGEPLVLLPGGHLYWRKRLLALADDGNGA